MAVSKPRRSHKGRPVERPGTDTAPPGSPHAGSPAAGTRNLPAPITAAAAGGAFSLWAMGLIGLAILTANPLTLNYAQITRAPLIVEGTFERREAGENRVRKLLAQRSWPAGRADETFVIETDGTLPLTPEQPYLVPLEPTTDGRYRIAPTPFSGPAIYPANRQTLAQLEAILSGRGAD